VVLCGCMRTNSVSMVQLVKRIQAGSFEIPQFQRDFVWNESQVTLLIDSIARNYPIGSLLLIEKTPNIRLASRSVDAVIQEADQIEDSNSQNEELMPNVSFVLDGQQRLTSIARVFLNASKKRTYYFDLRAMYEDFGDGSTEWIKSHSKGKEEPITKKNGRFLRSDIVMNQEVASTYVASYFEDSDYIEELGGDKQKARKATARINGIFEIIRNYEVPYILLNGDEGIESICRVFETINSTGTRLTTFDLAVARYFPEPNLRELYEESLKTYPVLKNFEVDGERILQVLAIMSKWESVEPSRSVIEPSRSVLLDLREEDVTNLWNDAAKSLADAYSWAERYCGIRPRNVTNQSLLVSIAAMFGIFDYAKLKTKPNFDDQLKKWFFANVLQRGVRATNYKIATDCNILFEFAETYSLKEIPKVQLDEDTVINLTKQDNRYKALLSLMYSSIKTDFWTGAKLEDNIEIEDHHIFPKTLGRRGVGTLTNLDSICNLVPLTKESNRELGDTPPHEYFKRLRQRGLEQDLLDVTQKRLIESLIPFDVRHSDIDKYFSTDNYGTFLRARAQMLLSRVREIIGEALITDKIDDEEV